MSSYIDIALVICCLGIFMQDVKARQVYLWLLIVAMLLPLLKLCVVSLLSQQDVLVNLTCILVLLVLVWGYAKIRNIAIKDNFGTGDVLFFITMALYYNTYTFLVVFNLSLLFSLLLHLVIKNIFTKNKEIMVPLAGYQALFVAMHITYILLF